MNWKPGVKYHQVVLERVHVERAFEIVEDGIVDGIEDILTMEEELTWNHISSKVNVISHETFKLKKGVDR